ncbi:MAG: hypothetical protein M4579_002787 [Chaenotheca gracillima]|nr:MAG: hypothetical protein M4579_002787 [Chaenotheca gracillima]
MDPGVIYRQAGSSGITSFLSTPAARDRTSPGRRSDDARLLKFLHNCPIRQDDIFVKFWAGWIEEAMMGGVHRVTRDWRSVDVLRRGCAETYWEKPITILVQLREGAEVSDWEGLRIWRTLRDVCWGACQSDVHVEIEVVRRDLGPLCGADQENGYNDSLAVGSSIGVEGSSSTGTLGGFLKLQAPDGIVHTLGVTCHHVMFNRTSHQELLLKGLLPGQWPAIPPLVSPSDIDHGATLQSWSTACFAFQKVACVVQQRISAGPRSAKSKEGWQQVEDRLQGLRGESERRQYYNREVGKPYCSSGFQVAPTGSALDWALVQIDDTIKCDNKLAKRPRLLNFLNEIEEGEACEFDVEEVTTAEGASEASNELEGAEDNEVEEGQRSDSDAAGVTTAEGASKASKEIKGAEDDELAEYDVQIGASGGRRWGAFNSILSNVRFDCSGISTREWTFVDELDQTFAPGDEGSWVVASSGILRGLVVGGSSAGLSYVTPIKTLVQSIEERTKCTVVWSGEEH